MKKSAREKYQEKNVAKPMKKESKIILNVY